MNNAKQEICGLRMYEFYHMMEEGDEVTCILPKGHSGRCKYWTVWGVLLSYLPFAASRG